MSSVKITKITITRVQSTYSGEIVIEAAYSESETRLDVGFIPTVFLKPMRWTARGVFQDGKEVTPSLEDYQLNQEVAISKYSVLRPSASKVATLSFTIQLSDLFAWGAQADITPETLALQGRVELKPEIFLSAAPIFEWRFATPVDTTDDRKGTITARGDNPPGELKGNLFDNQTSTKWLDFSPQGSWIQYAYAADIAGRLTGYTLTSAGDAPERDPADWQLLGSNNGGSTWVTVDSQTGISFSGRGQKLAFTLPGLTFKAWRLNITKVSNPSAANCVQLAEMELIGQQGPVQV